MDALVDAHVHLQLDRWPQMGRHPHPLRAHLGIGRHDIARFGVLGLDAGATAVPSDPDHRS